MGGEDTEQLQLCLKWNNFSGTVTSAFHSLHAQEELIDVTLAAEGQQFHAHRLVLAACSPYFRDILKKNPCQHPIIILREVSAVELQRVLLFMYEGQVNVPHAGLSDFIRLAAALKIRGLAEAATVTEDKLYMDNATSTAALLLQQNAAAKSIFSRAVSSHHSEAGSPTVPPLVSFPGLTEKSTANNTQSESLMYHPEKRSCHEVSNATKRQRVCSPAPSSTHTSASSPAPASSPPLHSTQDSCSQDRELRTDIENMLEVKLEPDDSPLLSVEDSSQQSPVNSGSSQASLHPPSITATTASSSHLSISHDSEEYSRLHGGYGSNLADHLGLPATAVNAVNTPLFILPKTAMTPEQQQFLIQQQLSLKSATNLQPEFPLDPSCQNLPYPCPFCDKAYMSWGFRRRHIKGCHTSTPELPCKWCFTLLPSHADWEEHVQKMHNLTLNAARNGLLILEEAHMVLQVAAPTRIDSLMELIKGKKCVNSTTASCSTSSSSTTSSSTTGTSTVTATSNPVTSSSSETGSSSTTNERQTPSKDNSKPKTQTRTSTITTRRQKDDHEYRNIKEVESSTFLNTIKNLDTVTESYEDKFKAELYKKYELIKKIFIPKHQYFQIIENVKAATVQTTSKTRHEYYLLEKYEVLQCGGVEKLIKKRSNPEQQPLYYVTIEDTYDVIKQAHIATGHGGRDRMAKEIGKKYVNITRDTIELFKSYCHECQQNKHPRTKGVVARPVLTNKFASWGLVDLINWPKIEVLPAVTKDKVLPAVTNDEVLPAVTNDEVLPAVTNDEVLPAVTNDEVLPAVTNDEVLPAVTDDDVLLAAAD